MFAGHAAWHQLVWVTIPLLLAFYVTMVGISIRSSARHHHRSVRAYFFPSTMYSSAKAEQCQHGVPLWMLRQCFGPACAMGICGVVLALLNIFSEKVGGGSCKADPFISATAANVTQRPSTFYQYSWVTLSCSVTGIMLHVTHMLQGRAKQAENLYAHLSMFMTGGRVTQRSAIAAWRQKLRDVARSTSSARRLGAGILTVPLLIVSSAPACAYIMSQK